MRQHDHDRHRAHLAHDVAVLCRFTKEKTMPTDAGLFHCEDSHCETLLRHNPDATQVKSTPT